jgi:hypothetical protein
MLYFPRHVAEQQCGGLPTTPQAIMAGQPLYSAKALRPLLAANFRAGKVPPARYEKLMSWFEKVLLP